MPIQAAKPTRRHGPPGLLFSLALAIALALAPASALAKKPPAGPGKQAILFVVIDSRDRPVAGALIELTPLQGRPVRPGPYRTNPKGQLSLGWRPASRNLYAETAIKDQLWEHATRLSFKVSAPGFLSASGMIERAARSQIMAEAKLKSLNRRAKLSPVRQVVVLRRPEEALSSQPAGPAQAKPAQTAPGTLTERLEAFRRAQQGLVGRLGAAFAWPAFRIKGGELTIFLDWQREAWGGLAPLPLLNRVVVSSGLPLAILCGQDLLPLDGVSSLRLVLASNQAPADDPHALPQAARVVIQAPAADFMALAKGSLGPDQFLARHQPALRTAKR